MFEFFELTRWVQDNIFLNSTAEDFRLQIWTEIIFHQMLDVQWDKGYTDPYKVVFHDFLSVNLDLVAMHMQKI